MTEQLLRLPVFLTIPDTGWTGSFHLPWQKRDRRFQPEEAGPAAANGNGRTETAIGLWNPENHLQTHTEGLRERLLTYCEVHNLNHKKPKLVALTGCGVGAGVSTLASGLAAALSKTGDGNVLLVNMNLGHGVAHSFANGKPGCVLSDILETDAPWGAPIHESLALVSTKVAGHEEPPKPLPAEFKLLVPKLKASDYDYIIFDLPPVSPTSVTPRIASHMDIVLMVLESEKTGQHQAAKASALMRESRANVVAVLNKCRQHVPAWLSQDL